MLTGALPLQLEFQASIANSTSQQRFEVTVVRSNGEEIQNATVNPEPLFE
jgi:hypothetical protein